MKVKIGDKIFDSEKEPIAIIFETDKDRKQAGLHITNMEPREGVRIYVQYPKSLDSKEISKFIDKI